MLYVGSQIENMIYVWCQLADMPEFGFQIENMLGVGQIVDRHMLSVRLYICRMLIVR